MPCKYLIKIIPIIHYGIEYYLQVLLQVHWMPAAASIQFYLKTGKGPVIVFIYIASGVFGKEAFSMSQYIAFAGLLFHYLIAISFTTFYFLIYPKIKWLHRNKILDAVIYGIFVWFIMNRVVVPLSKAQSFPFNIQKALIAASILIVCIGVPVSFIASSFYKNRLKRL